ncbi:hypothetical protein [Candidatus Ichthyocystis hellenicum]|uniref:hypothetical protein n=1 Tax=Candidatus Ichthyocystis hellenicum TaxID=1561003 RepID=UPI000B86A8AF|nr:hypothetical protein [Candidatus Ichthyocystis hellenicum]
MSIVGLRDPCTLLELSMKPIFGIDFKGSLDHLMQLPPTEIFELAPLMLHNGASFYRNEFVSESESVDFMFPHRRNKFCSDYRCHNELRLISSFTRVMEKVLHVVKDMFPEELPDNAIDCLWRRNPLYQIVNTKDSSSIIKSYHERKNDVLALRKIARDKESLILPVLTSSSDIFCYYDPMCFFPVYVDGNRCVSVDEIYKLVWSMLFDVRMVVYDLEESRYSIGKVLYHLSMAGLLQVLKTLSWIDEIESKFIGKRKSIIDSLNIITNLRKLKEDIYKLDKTILFVIKNCNSVPLEGMLKVFERATTGNYLMTKCEIVIVYSFLKRKYHSLIEIRKSKIKYLLKKIEQSDEGGDEISIPLDSIDYISKSIKKLNEEVREMEIFMVNLS